MCGWRALGIDGALLCVDGALLVDDRRQLLWQRQCGDKNLA